MEMHFNTSEVLLLELVLIRYVNLAKVGVYRSAQNISRGVFCRCFLFFVEFCNAYTLMTENLR